MDMKMPTQGVMKYPRAEVWASTPPVQKLQLQSGGGWSRGLPWAGDRGGANDSSHFPLCTSQLHLLASSALLADKTQEPMQDPRPALCFFHSCLSLLLSTYYVLIFTARSVQSEDRTLKKHFGWKTDTGVQCPWLGSSGIRIPTKFT